MPFEITVCNLVIRYWTTAIPTWAVCLIFLALYAALNYIRVSGYGEAEFWMSIGKVILIVGLILYTFIVMVGGNPKHDAFGFRYWKNPGAFTTKYREGDLGRFLGFLYCLFQAAFVVAGPEYVSMTAGEVRNQPCTTEYEKVLSRNNAKSRPFFVVVFFWFAGRESTSSSSQSVSFHLLAIDDFLRPRKSLGRHQRAVQ